MDKFDMSDVPCCEGDSRETIDCEPLTPADLIISELREDLQEAQDEVIELQEEVVELRKELEQTRTAAAQVQETANQIIGWAQDKGTKLEAAKTTLVKLLADMFA